MSLIGALNIGQSAMTAASAAIQVTGNNISNASDPNYTREVVDLSPSVDVQDGNVLLGTGVTVESVSRQVDQSLNSQLNSANSDAAAAGTSQQWLTQVQSAFNELNGQGLSSTLSTFFNGWSTLANSPQDTGQRQVVIQDGQDVTQQFQSIRSQLLDLQNSANSQITALAGTANSLATQIATLNTEIVNAQGGSAASANALQDQRDAAVSQLSQLINVKTVPQSDGSLNVYAGSDPLVVAGTSYGITTQQTSANGEVTTNLAFKTNNGTISVSSGQIGALISTQGQISDVVGQLDTLAKNLAYTFNKVYSSGQGLQGFSSVTATNSVSNAGAALDQTAAGLPYTPTNGSFVIHVQDPSGQETSTLINVNLGQGTNGTSLNALAGELNAVSGVTATVASGQLSIAAANSGETVTFSQDSSGVLAALGVNTFFSGSDASNLAVNSKLIGAPQYLAAAQNGQSDDNQTAVALAALETQGNPVQGDPSLSDQYQSIINGVATNVSAAKANSDAATNTQQALKAQQQSISGVSVNEEAVNLIQEQQAFQGAAAAHLRPGHNDGDPNEHDLIIMSTIPSFQPLAMARVSLLTQSDSASQSIDNTQVQLAQIEQEISTGKQVNVPSDNPSAAAVIMQLQQTLNTQTAYADNLNQAGSQLSEADSTLGTLNNLLLQAQNIASANVGSDVTASQRQAAASVVASIYQQAINIGNTQFEGSYLFGGDNADQAPFVNGSSGLVYNGSPTTLANTVAPDTNLSFQVDGNAVFGALSTQVQGSVSLNPAANAQTRLTDLGGATGQGVAQGSIQISDGSKTVVVNLSDANSLGDVVKAINSSPLGDVTAVLNNSSIQLTGTGGTNISVSEVGGGTTARDLGLLTANGGAGTDLNGQNLNVKVTDVTPLASLNNGSGLDTSGLTISNGQNTAHISFASANNVQDMLNAINAANLGVRASINAAGTGINIVNAVQGSAMTIAENGGTTAAELGVRSFTASTPLSQLNGGKGVTMAASGEPDFQIQNSAGTTFTVTLGTASTVQDVINEINSASTAAGADVTANFASTGNGIVLTDNSSGGGSVTVSDINSSSAAHDLGLTTGTASGNVLQGSDVNPVSPQGIFADLSALQKALNNSDSAGITSAAQGLQTDYNRVSVIAGQTGAQAQEVSSLQTQAQSSTLATQTLLSSLQDTDMTTAITRFQSLQTSLQAELQTQADSLGLSLLNFLQ